MTPPRGNSNQPRATPWAGWLITIVIVPRALPWANSFWPFRPEITSS